MPPLRICGRELPFAPDDIWMFMWMFIPVHTIDMLFDWKCTLHPRAKSDPDSLPKWAAAHHMPWAAEYSGTLIPGLSDHFILGLDFKLCAVLVPLEALICCLSAYGVIVRPRKFDRLFVACMWLWLLLVCLTWLLYFVMVIPDAIDIVTTAFTNLPETAGELASTLLSWDFVRTYWMTIVAWCFVALRLCVYWVLLITFCYLSLPVWARTQFVEGAVVFAFKMIGVHNLMIQSIMQLLVQDILCDVCLDNLAITDIVYGMLLVMASQLQGVINIPPEDDDVANAPDDMESLLRADHDLSCYLSRSKRRACRVEGSCRCTTPLDPSNKTDQEVMHELHHLAPFASGIYGQVMFGMPLAVSCFQPGTWLPTGCCRCLCDSLPCCQQLPKGASCADAARRRCCCCSPLLRCCVCCKSTMTEGDFPWGGNEDRLRHTLNKAAEREGIRAPELYWASWTNYGHDRATPIGVVLDHAYKRIVITIRGSADLTDCVSDIGVIPTFFDPLNLAKPEDRRFPPFDTNRDCFVPSVWLGIAEDHVRMLRGKRILESLLEPIDKPGPYEDYSIVVTGHSLGAGVACLVALILRGRLPEKVHVQYMGFEPPGCVLSGRLARETQRLNWVSGVTAYDFVPRLSVQNARRIFDKSMEELERCNRSKFQLCLLTTGGMIRHYNLCLIRCLSRLVAGIFQTLGGGPLLEDAKSATACFRYKRVEPVELPRSKCQFPEMFLPGVIVYMRPVAEQRLCVGMVKDSAWRAEWSDPEDFNGELILSTRVLSYHVPWIYEDAIRRVLEWFKSSAGAPPAEPFRIKSEHCLRPTNEP